MISKKISVINVQLSDSIKLLEIGQQTFYDAFGPPVNTEENIRSYLNTKFTLKQIRKELQDPNSFFYFAILNTQIVGYLKLNIKDAQTELLNGNSMEIERIYVIKEFQGQKIGQFLLDTSLQMAKDQNTDFVWLGVWDKNDAAIRFYRRNGFKIFANHEFLLGSELQTDILLKLEIYD